MTASAATGPATGQAAEVDAGAIAILALAGVLLLLPAPVDRWALRHGASPETLIALATITLTGIAAIPMAFLI